MVDVNAPAKASGPRAVWRCPLIENMAVSPDQQGQGLGSLFLAKADDRARALGFSQIRLYTDEQMHENLEFYARHGYVRTHDATEDGFNRVYFLRTVHPARSDDRS